MLIIPVLADALLPSSLFSCRLKGLELSVSFPSSTYSTLYQLSGSAALIIIWPHLFGWLGELWFSFRMLCEHRKAGVSIHLSALTLLYFPNGYFVTEKPPLMQRRLKLPRPGLRPFFFTNHWQLTLRAGKRWHLRFHYRPLVKSSYTNTQERHVKRSA